MGSEGFPHGSVAKSAKLTKPLPFLGALFGTGSLWLTAVKAFGLSGRVHRTLDRLLVRQQPFMPEGIMDKQKPFTTWLLG